MLYFCESTNKSYICKSSKDMEIKDRIKIIMEKENMASGAFAESIGIQQSTLSHILNGRNNPSLDVIMKVHQKYNYVKLEWLLYGQGNISEESIQSASDFQPSLFAENAIIPPKRDRLLRKSQGNAVRKFPKHPERDCKTRN